MTVKLSPFGWIVVLSILFQVVVLAMVTSAYGHSIYTGIYPNGQLTPDKPGDLQCCGDYDCEPLTPDEIDMGIGQVRMYSNRHKEWITVAETRVTFGDIVTDKSAAAGHWCGRKKYDHEPTNEAQPDPKWHTFCAFVRPGGV